MLSSCPSYPTRRWPKKTISVPIVNGTPYGSNCVVSPKLFVEPNSLEEIDRYLQQHELTPEHAAAAVRENVEAFEKEFDVKAHESENYYVLTNLGPAWERKIAVRMDGIFREYQKRLAFKEKISKSK